MQQLPQPNGEVWEFRLYTAGRSPRSLTALKNIQRICDEKLNGKYKLKVIDLLKFPKLAAQDEIIAIPTLVRTWPPPLRRLIGDLSQTERVVAGLELDHL